MKLRLMFRGILTLTFMWGLVFALVLAVEAIVFLATDGSVTAAVIFTYLPVVITLGILFLQFLLSPFFMDLNLRWLYKMTWIHPEQLPPHLAKFIAEQEAKHGISIKKVGMIHDQNPQAFTYGHFKKNARVVLSDGILNLLTPEEQVAVVGHELGHIAHMDFLFMTIAAAVPVILYTFYAFSRGVLRTMRYTSKSGGKDSGKAAAAIGLTAFVFMVISYLFYIISQFLVLFLSRVREYYADSFSAENTGNPKGLSTALVKIAYGMVQSQAAYATQMHDKSASTKGRVKASQRYGFTNAIRSMNIFDVKAAQGLVMSAYAQSATAEIEPEMVVRAAAWDLESPWATYLELQSTHPLAAKRLLALDDIAEEMGLKRAYPTLGEDKIHETLWDEFLVDLFVYYALPSLMLILPALGSLVILAGINPLIGVGGGLALAALLWIWRIKIRYPKISPDLPIINIIDAVTDVSDDRYAEASPVRGKPIKLEGLIIGRGQAGYYFSEDMVLQDSTGIITLDYNPVFNFMRWITALFRVEKLIGNRVIVFGWYRRSPKPYVMIKKMIKPDGKKIGSNWDIANWLLVFVLLIVAFVLVVLGLGIV
ncbi:MAG: M48 family metalloprotease [Candidatus Heimdallarchaeum endolithica]|uniref:M48 family metalloprotease n=1 Tax=Candidatus Heimdallarchaeum endolithica TaxID=2876572 RepID=A0A9Y1BR75_9ARCH|nr:MAG: M48 family metalloprotease [Candidatus Heimdallarchaeum endolithica]